MKKNKLIAFTLLAIAGLALTSCKGKKEASADGKPAARKIIAATGAGIRPNAWYENGKLIGYEVEILEKVFAELPQYELELQKTEFASIFTGLDAGLFQIGFNQLEYNHTRGEKYIISDVNGVIPRGATVRKGQTEIKSIFDLPGHSTYALPTNANANLYRRWNKEHPGNEVDVRFVEEYGNYLLDIEEGRIDFMYHFVSYLKDELDVKGFNDKLEIVPFETADKEKFTGTPDGMFYLFPIGEEQLAADFNAKFEELVENGTINEIFNKYQPKEIFDNKLDLDYIKYYRDFIAKDQGK